MGGTLDILEDIAHRGHDNIWRWSFWGGVLSFLTGLFGLSRFLLGTERLPVRLSMLIAATAMARGAANIMWAWRMRHTLEGEGWLLLWGAITTPNEAEWLHTGGRGQIGIMLLGAAPIPQNIGMLSFAPHKRPMLLYKHAR